MTDISVRHDPSTGAATIEIRDADTSETRFRLRDPYTEKYLTKRGWSKTASFLPGDAVRDDDVLALTLDADLARRIVPGTNLSLEQPATEFQEILTWPLPVATPIIDAPDDERPTEEVPAAETPAEEASAEAIETPRESERKPLQIDSFEPTIMHDRMHDDAKPEKDPVASLIADNDDRPSTWKPAAIAAIVCLLLGAGIGYVWSGSGNGGASVDEARKAAAIQLEKQKWEFDRQLADAKQASMTSADKTKASDTQLAAAREEARKALADKEKSIAALQKQLTDAEAQIDAVKNAAGGEARAQIDVLDKKVAALTGELDKAGSELTRRDQLLQDAQAKLSNTDKELATAREKAGQDANALKSDLAKQTEALNTQLDQLKQQLAGRDRDLKQAQARLEDADAQLASARDAAKSQQATQNDALTKKLNGLTADLKKSEQQLAERDAALRDLQAKLSVANIQIDALKAIANKTTEAGLEKTAMSQKLEQLSAELDKTGQNLSDREQALADATAKLRDAESKLAAANKRNDQLAADAGQGPADNQTEAASDENAGRLQEERDLYANELKSMTSKFSALQAEKVALEKSVADLQAQIKDTGATTTSNTSKAVWGATAIDRTGAVYSLQNQVSEKIAQENVAAMCRGKSGARCETLSSYSNACFSLARLEGEQPAPDNYAYFVHKSWKMASVAAKERCESMGMRCTVRFTACSPDALSKPASNE